MPRPRRHALRRALLPALALAGATSLRAQSVTRSDFSLGVAAADVAHPAFGMASGLAIRYALPSRTEAYTFRLGWDRVRTARVHADVRCPSIAASVSGDVCGAYGRSEQAALSTASVGFGVRAFRRPRVTLDATVDGRIGAASIVSRGDSDPGSSSLTEPVLGADVGGELTVMPLRRIPFGLAIGAAYGVVKDPIVQDTDGGPMPFDDAFGVLRAHLSFVWRPSARARR